MTRCGVLIKPEKLYLYQKISSPISAVLLNASSLVPDFLIFSAWQRWRAPAGLALVSGDINKTGKNDFSQNAILAGIMSPRPRQGGRGPAEFFRGARRAENPRRISSEQPPVRHSMQAGQRLHQEEAAGQQASGGQLRGKPARSAQYARSWLRLAAHKESRSRPGPGESSNDEDRTSIKPRKGAGCFFDKRVGRPSELQRLFKLWCPLVTFGVSKNRGCLHRVSTL